MIHKILNIEFKLIDGVYKKLTRQPCNCDCHTHPLKHFAPCCNNGYIDVINDITPQDIIDSYNAQKEYLKGTLPNCNWLITFLEVIEQVNSSKTWRGDFVVTIRDNNCFFHKRQDEHICNYLGEDSDSKHKATWIATQRFMDWFSTNIIKNIP